MNRINKSGRAHKMKEKMYYKLFSFALLKFLYAHGINPISNGTHENGKPYWIFIMDDELSRVLKAYTSYKECKNYKL